MDTIDRNILRILQQQGRITNAQLASDIGISPPATLERVRRLEKEGVIKQYVALLDPAKVHRDIIVWVQVTLEMHQLSSMGVFQEAVTGISEVQECYHITGEADYLLKISVAGIAEYEKLIQEKLTRIPGIRQMTSSMALSVVKRETRLIINDPA